MEKLFEFASEYAKGYAEVGYDDDQIASVRDAFIDGAEWQKNHVWHSADDDPPINCKEVLIEYGNYYHDIGFYDKDSNMFQLRIDEAVRMEDVDRWAYLEDLGAL
jgi:hypothetical protein